MDLHEYVSFIGNRLKMLEEEKNYKEYLRLMELLKDTIEEKLPEITQYANEKEK